MSEDLEWANCIKNEGEDLDRLRFEQSARVNIHETRSLQSTPERAKDTHRKKSCDPIFGSASSRRRFKKSSRINSRRSSISSNMQRGLNKSKSKDQLHQLSSSGVFLESKSLQLLNKDGSKTKRYRDSSRDSYDSHRLGRQSLGNLQPRTLFFSKQEGSQQASLLFDETTKDDFSVGQHSYFGSQMNQLITSMKPQSSLSFLSFRLSQNALRYIFPIREQKILIKRPGKDGQFAQARVVIKLEDLNQIIPHLDLPAQQRPSLTPKEPTVASEAQAQPVPAKARDSSLTAETNQPSPKTQVPAQPDFAPIVEKTTPTKKTKLGLTNQVSVTSVTPEQELQQMKELIITYFLNGHYNDLLKNEDPQKSIELKDEDPLKVKTIEELLDKLEQTEVSFKFCRLCECILTDPNAVQ